MTAFAFKVMGSKHVAVSASCEQRIELANAIVAECEELNGCLQWLQELVVGLTTSEILELIENVLQADYFKDMRGLTKSTSGNTAAFVHKHLVFLDQIDAAIRPQLSAMQLLEDSDEDNDEDSEEESEANSHENSHENSDDGSDDGSDTDYCEGEESEESEESEEGDDEGGG